MENLDSLINELNSIVLQAKKQPFSSNDIIVSKSELLDLISRIRDAYPEVIRESQEIVKERETILQKASDYANSICDEAEAKAKNMVAQSELVKSAENQSQSMINEANEYYRKVEWQGRSLAYENLKKVTDVLNKSLEELTNTMKGLAD